MNAAAKFARLLPDRFVLMLLAAVALAAAVPARGGFAVVVDWLATIAVVLLFFLHGVRLPREAVLGGLMHWRLHLTILASTFLLFPLLGLALSIAFPTLLPAALWAGVLFLCALPSTVQSSISFTSIAGGNVAGAVAAATASNLLGIGLTPLIVTVLSEAQGGAVSLAGTWKIVVQILLPFVAGHLSRPWLASLASRHQWLLVLNDRGTILLAVYSAFSAAVVAGAWRNIAPHSLAILLGLCALILALVLSATWTSPRAMGFSREDSIAILFCGSKKSIVSGVPMARVLFPGPTAGMIVLPAIIFHQMQLIVCAWLASRLAARQRPGDAAAPGNPA